MLSDFRELKLQFHLYNGSGLATSWSLNVHSDADIKNLEKQILSDVHAGCGGNSAHRFTYFCDHGMVVPGNCNKELCVCKIGYYSPAVLAEEFSSLICCLVGSSLNRRKLRWSCHRNANCCQLLFFFLQLDLSQSAE